MKKLKRGLSLLLIVVMVLSLLPASVFAAQPQVHYDTTATVLNEKGTASGYTNVVKNWGTRGEPATFLSPMAEAFYGDLTYGVLEDYTYDQMQALMVENHTTFTKYDNDTKYLLAYTDCQDNGYYISCFYSGNDIGPAWDSGLTWNREHTWPQSKICNDTTGYAVQDIMMIRPTDSNYNSGRNNSAYGLSSGYYHPNNYTTTQDLRGDAARSVLYGYVRWGMEDNMWSSTGVIESQEVLLSWMAADPVDTWEMGRNDSVQSITGTRNIFIDYPELAFALFGEEVPTDLSSPSGQGKKLSYTVTASSNNESWGSVYVNDNTVTAFPQTGYEVSGYSLLSGAANVTRSGNVFIADGACSIQVVFAKTVETKVCYIQNGQTVSAVTAEPNTVVMLPEYSGDEPEGYTFHGWVTQTLEATEQGPAVFYQPGDPYTVSAGVNCIYALYTYVDMSLGGEQWVLVTDAAQLSAGTKVVVVSSTKDVALSTTQNTNNRGTAAITKNTDNTVSWTGTAVQELTLETGTVTGSWGLSTGSGYLYAASSSKNWLRTQSTLDANASWSISVTTAGVATVKAQGTNSRNWMRYNSQSNLFACYSSGQYDIELYRAVAGGTTMYTTLNNPVEEVKLFAVCAGGTELGSYAALGDALDAYDPATSYIKVLNDTDVEVALTADLYIDLNGKTLSGIMDTAGFRVYGMDSSTDGYTCDSLGYLACEDAEGSNVVPETVVQTSVTGEARRYLAIETGNGYSFHRFYLGLTHYTVKTTTKGVGYKATFAGDDMVKEKIDSFGYTLLLEGNDAVTCSKTGDEFVSLKELTLRVDNYDVEKHGETPLSAQVFMVMDGQTVTGTTYSLTLKSLVERINESVTLDETQKSALAAWVAESETMQTWDVNNIIA